VRGLGCSEGWTFRFVRLLSGQLGESCGCSVVDGCLLSEYVMAVCAFCQLPLPIPTNDAATHQRLLLLLLHLLLSHF
jgi:hypothetical protein